jgi:hypothetical protein
MVQARWVKNYLDCKSRCNIIVGGTACGRKLKKQSSSVKSHIKQLYSELFNKITGENQVGTDALTLLSRVIGKTSAPMNILHDKDFKVSLFFINL